MRELKRKESCSSRVEKVARDPCEGDKIFRWGDVIFVDEVLAACACTEVFYWSCQTVSLDFVSLTIITFEPFIK